MRVAQPCQLTQLELYQNHAAPGSQSIMYAGLEIVVCHLPFSEQNMNMADQNQVGLAI